MHILKISLLRKLMSNLKKWREKVVNNMHLRALDEVKVCEKTMLA